MKPTKAALSLLAVIITAPPSLCAELEIEAGGISREGSVVSIPAPGLASGPVNFQSSSGEVSAVGQVSQDGILTLVSPKMEAGQKMRLAPATAAAHPAPDRVTTSKKGDVVEFMTDGKTAFSYQAAARKDTPTDLNPKFLRGGYLHPLLTPAGKAVTDDYPADHLHHHGIWMAWSKTSVEGRTPDFWNMGQGKGKVDFLSLESTWSGVVEAGLIAKHRYTDLTATSPLDILEETWTVRAYAARDTFRIIDLEASHTTLDGKTLELPIYHYGGLGIRGRGEWNGKDNATFITSENLTDRQKANGQPARWISMTGNVEGGIATLSILSHPENFRSPQPVRIHPSEPFISFAPQTNEAMSIKPGETYKARYRLIVSDGKGDPELLEQLWQDYAQPIKAVWKE